MAEILDPNAYSTAQHRLSLPFYPSGRLPYAYLRNMNPKIWRDKDGKLVHWN